MSGNVAQAAAPPVTVAAGDKQRRRRHRRWPWVLLTGLVLVLFCAYAALNCFAAYWIAHNGTIKGGEPSVSELGFPARNVDYAPGLVAWFAPPAAGHFTAVIVHGFQANRSHVLATARALAHLGDGVLCPDLGYVSGKTAYGGGDRESRQVIEAVNFAHANSPRGTPVVLIGYSEGGAEAILAADRGARVAAVVSDSAPVSFLSIATQRSGVPSWLLAGTYLVYGWFSGGASLEDLGSVLPGHYHVPTLVIQGTKDTTVPYSEGVTLARLAHATLWTVQGVGHDKAFAKDPTLYVHRLVSFLDAAIARHR